jgi:hypothetical protein
LIKVAVTGDRPLGLRGHSIGSVAAVQERTLEASSIAREIRRRCKIVRPGSQAASRWRRASIDRDGDGRNFSSARASL